LIYCFPQSQGSALGGFADLKQLPRKEEILKIY
jgi:hypothetical protein